MSAPTIEDDEKCDWRWQNGDSTVARKCIRPAGHTGNHIGFWSQPNSSPDPKETS